MQQSRHAEDVVVADIGHGAFHDALAALQTTVALERIPRSLAVDPMEHVQLTDPRYEHQLYREGSHNKNTGWVISDVQGVFCSQTM